MARLTLAAAASLSSVAVAQPDVAQPSEGDTDQARVHFQRGAQFYREGNFDAALAEFTRANELAPNYRVLYNIGQVQVERHDYVAALLAFGDYLEQGAGDVPEDRRTQVESEIADLKTRISELMVTGNVAGAELSVDGVSAGVLPLKSPILVSAGSRHLTLHKRGYTTAERTLIVAGGDQPEVSLTLEPLASAAAPVSQSAAPSPAAGHSSSAGLWVSLVATGAFASGAVVFGVLAQNRNRDLDTELSRYPADRLRVSDLRVTVKRDAALCDGLASASAVSAIFAIYFLASGPGHADTKPGAASSTRLVPLARGVALTGEF